MFLEKTDLTSRLKIKALTYIIKLQEEISKLKESLKDQKELDLNEIEDPSQQNVLSAFKCPITHEIMTEPVFLSDGHTYERTAIEQWLQNHNTSPMTGLQLTSKQLTPSHTLKSMIREFIDANKKK